METFNRCLQSLKVSSSDNEKLAALMVISKICDKINNIEPELTVQLFDAVTPKFLVRLIRAKSTDTNKNTFKIIAFNILLFFARTHPLILLKDEEHGDGLINQIIKILHPLQNDENKFLYKDSLDIFLSLAKLDMGAKVLIQKKVFTQVGRLILEEEHTETVILIFNLLLHHGSKTSMSKLDEDFMKYMYCLVESFQSNQELLKFQYLQIIMKLFQIIAKLNFQINYTDDGEFVFILNKISIACKDIMQSRVKANIKRSVIILLCNLIKVFGKEWIFDKKCVKHIGNFVVLLLTVISVEINFLFHTNITEDELSDQTATESGLYISQNILTFICSDSFEQIALVTDNSFILKVFSTFKNIMASVYEFLSTVDLSSELQLDNSILISAISMLTTWATEETENLREELQIVLPILMTIGRKDLQEVLQNECTPVILDTMIPCISQLLPDKKMSQVLISNDCHDLYGQYITYLLTCESFNTKIECLESLLHMMHQFTILEPILCCESLIFLDLYQKLLNFICNLSIAQLSSYSCLEVIAVALTFARMYKMEFGMLLQKVIKVSIQFVYDLTGHCCDDNEFSQIWIIAMQNIIECFGIYKQLAECFIGYDYLKDWSKKHCVSGSIKGIIDELVSMLSIR